MSNLITYFIIYLIRFYKYFFSPILGNKCRYLPTCSDYFIEALKIHGILKGSLLGFKRIGRCHPVKLLGGGSGLDIVPNKKICLKGKNLNGK
ncbi:MAG: membrane protein insertion efficiency factor YidD [Pelagibacteraceae bacterium]